MDESEFETPKTLAEWFPAAYAPSVHGHKALAHGTRNLTQHTGRKARKTLSTRSRMILTLEMRGNDIRQIAAQLGLSAVRVSQITRSDRYIEAREALLGRMDHEFTAMKPAVFQALRNGITSRDENTALRASEAWMRAAGFGQYGKGATGSGAGVTAEDIVQRLLQVNVNVNVEK